jgi:hypothetical protein
MKEEFEPFVVALDLKLMKVGSPLLQAALGGSHRLLEEVPTGAWLEYPTPELELYRVKDARQMALCIEVLKNRAGKW